MEIKIFAYGDWIHYNDICYIEITDGGRNLEVVSIKNNLKGIPDFDYDFIKLTAIEDVVQTSDSETNLDCVLANKLTEWFGDKFKIEKTKKKFAETEWKRN